MWSQFGRLTLRQSCQIGKPVDGVEVKIMSDFVFDSLPVKSAKFAAIRLWHSRAIIATKRRMLHLDGSPIRTGDLGFIDKEGFLSL